MLCSMSPATQFLVDAEGRRTSVVLPMAEYEALLEDLEDLAAVAERRNEESVSLEEVEAQLKLDGLLPD